MRLEKYQIEGANFLANNPHALLADDMGLGKTAQAVAACDIAPDINGGGDILVVCPASVKYHWAGEFSKWSADFHTTDVVEGRKHIVNYDANVVIVNYELLLSDHVFDQLMGRFWKVLICDEAHYVKNFTAQRTMKVLGLRGLVSQSSYKWMLTGTPVENRPVDLFPILHVLAGHLLEKYNDYESYVLRYCDGYYDQYTGEITAGGATHEEELGERIKPFMLRRTLEHELPETVTQIISLKKSREVESIEEGMSDPNAYYAPMAELGAMASLRQEVALAKLPRCVEYVKDIMESVDKLVIFAYHRSVINNLELALKKYKPVKYYGGLSAAAKEKAKNGFIKGSSRVFIGQIQAAGTGLDGLQHVCHHMLFVEMDWLPFKQCIGRLKRKGQKEKVVVQLLVTKDSIEESMLSSVASKLKSINKILGDK